MPYDMDHLDKFIVENLTDGLLAFDRECRYIRWNSALEKISGLKASEVNGRNAFEVFPFLKETGLDEFYYSALAGDSRTTGKRAFNIPETGHSGFFEGAYSPLKNASGEIIGGVATIRDITQRVKEAEQTGEERFRAMVDRVQNIIFATDSQGRIIFTNEYGLKFVGLKDDQVEFQYWLSVIHPDDCSMVTQAWTSALRDGTTYELQTRLKRAADGAYRWVLARAHPIKTSQGDLIEWVGTVTDIHEQVIGSQRSVELQAISAELSSAITAAEVAEIFLSKGLAAAGGHCGVIALLAEDRQAVKLFASKGYSKSTIEKWKLIPLSLSIPITEAIHNRKPRYVYSIQHAKRQYPIIVEAMQASHEQAHAALPLIVKNEVIGVLSIGFPEPKSIEDDQERYMLTLAGLCSQALERSRVYESERAARSLAESANTAKSNFLATVSHEIRTPLSSIIGYSELLSKPNLAAEKRKEFISGIDRNGKVLIHLVDDILDLSKIEAGHLAVEKVEFHLASSLCEVIETLTQQADRKKIKFNFELNSAAPVKIISDPYRLRQILLNVIGNAIKFTEVGSVNVKMSIQEQTSMPSHLVFMVDDTGVGLARGVHAQLFQPFSQGHDDSGYRRGGTGLGLVIARKLARMLDGDVKLIASSPEKGSCFEVRIGVGDPSMILNHSARLEEKISSTRPEEISLAGMKVLIAEDAIDVQVILAAMLTEKDAEVHLASNGQDAIEFALLRDFDLIVMDLQMPILDGYAATAHLRDSGFTKPIVALTANALVDVRKSLKMGFDAHLLKPINANSFLRTVYDLTRAKP